MSSMRKLRGITRLPARFLVVALIAAVAISALAVSAASAQSDSNDAVTVSEVSVFSDGKWYGYSPGDEIQVAVRFTGEISVTGEPQISLDIGGETETAALNNTFSTSLTFKYTVEEGDVDDDGFSIPANSLSLNGGTIQDSSGTDINLDHSEVTTTSEVGPVPVQNEDSARVLFLTITSDPGADGVYSDEYLTVTVDFSEDIEAVHGVWIVVDVGGTEVTGFSDVVLGSTVEFNAWMSGSLADTDGVSIHTNSLRTNGGAVEGVDGNPAYLEHNALPDDPDHKVGIQPEIQSVSFNSEPAGEYYKDGDRIEVLVTFNTYSLRVDHTDLPSVELTLDSGTADAGFSRSHGGLMYFSYIISYNDYDDDGVEIAANAFSGSVASNSGLVAATTHNAVAADGVQLVDAVPPTFSSAETNEDGNEVTLTFSEDLMVPSLLSSLSSLFDVTLDLFFRAVLDVVVDDDEFTEETGATLDGNTIVLSLGYSITEGQDVEVTYNNNFASDSKGLFKDSAGNTLALFSEEPVTNNSTVEDAAADTTNLVLGKSELKFLEGSSGTVTIKLSSAPSNDVTVTPSAYPTSNVTFSPATFTFTTTDWNTAQTLTVNVAADDNSVNSWHRVTLAADGGGYENESSGLRVLATE